MEDITTQLLAMLQSSNRERLLKRLRSGEIDQEEFDDELNQKALVELTARLQSLAPGLTAPDPNDENADYPGFIDKVITELSAEDSEHQKTLRRAKSAQVELVNAIFDDWEQLRINVDTHSETLDKRWSKKPEQKRVALLLDAWPAMNRDHRPDFYAIRHKLTGSDHRDALMMPYINLKDLSDKNSLHLPSLIRSRTMMGPEHFAFVDSMPFQTAIKMGAVKPAAAFSQVMLLTGQQTRKTYGQLRTIEDTVDLENILWTDFGFLLGQGIVILENQRKLYRFLVRCTELLLHDMDLAKSITNGPLIHPQRTTGPGRTATPPKNKEWQSLLDMNIQAAYHLPQPFCVDSLLKLAGAKRDGKYISVPPFVIFHGCIIHINCFSLSRAVFSSGDMFRGLSCRLVLTQNPP